MNTEDKYISVNKKNRFNALCSQEESDHKFLVEIIAQICDYAVDNDMKPNDTMITIANNLLMLTEIANYDNWNKRAENVRQDRCSNYNDCYGTCFIDDTPCKYDGDIEKCVRGDSK